MFTLQTRDLDSAHTYAQALHLYEHAVAHAKGKEPRCGDYRIPHKWTSRQLGIRKLRDDSIAIRYHNTDVVTWRPDDSVVLQPGVFSRSTQAVMNNFTPHSVHIVRDGSVLMTPTRAYALSSRSARFVPVANHLSDRWDYAPAPEAHTHGFQRDVLNKPVARQVLAETRYAEYRKWHQVMSNMFKDSHYRRYVWVDRAGAMEDLALGLVDCPEERPVGWIRLFACPDYRPDALRQVIYDWNRHRGTYTRETVESLDLSGSANKYAELQKWKTL